MLCLAIKKISINFFTQKKFSLSTYFLKIPKKIIIITVLYPSIKKFISNKKISLTKIIFVKYLIFPRKVQNFFFHQLTSHSANLVNVYNMT